MKKRILATITLCLLLLMSMSITTWAAETEEGEGPDLSTEYVEEITKAPSGEKINAKLGVPKMSTVTRKKKGVTTIKWGKISKVTGYQIQYGVKSDFSDAKNVEIPKQSTTSRKIKKMSTTKDTWIRMRSYKKVGSSREYSNWSARVKLIVWKSSWTYANRSKIHSDPAVLYYSTAAKKKNITVAVNAGHGCKGGSSKKTLCHPDGSAKVTGGSTAAGAKTATAINEGTSVGKSSEASVNLKVAQKLKAKLLAGGYNVLMIRQDSNTQLDNIARTVMANNNASCHIAIHFDSTNSNKGAFYISVPNVSSYRNMKPVKSHWRQHNSLGSKLVGGLKSAGVKIWSSGSMALDLTQTSYSTVPSVDIEVGDRKTSTSNKNLNKIANGLYKGVVKYFAK